mgnify:CR=1 FL=1
MFSELDHIRKELGSPPRRIGFMGFGWGERVFPVPSNLNGLTPNDEPLLDTIFRQKDIWKNGQIVWGYVVMANRDLYLPDENDRPGDVVYSLSATDEQAFDSLPKIANALYSEKTSDKQLGSYTEAERGVVEHLRLETDRAFGMPLPDSMRRGLQCHLSTFWGHRAHLPGRALGGKFVPLLVLAGKVHDVLIIPAKYWPSSLAVPWEQTVLQRAAKRSISEKRIASHLAWKTEVEKSGQPPPWLDATPESIFGSWAGEVETEISDDQGPHLLSLLSRQEWEFAENGKCRLEFSMQPMENGEPADDAPDFRSDQSGTFSIDEGVITVLWEGEETSSASITVISSGEMFDGAMFWLHRTKQPTHEERTAEVTDGGSTIYLHKPRAASGFSPPDMSESNLQAIDAHVEEHIGKIENVWHELVSDIVHLDVHVVSPRPDRHYYTLVTSGMSDLPMSVPQGAEDFRFAELMICLPAEWKLTQKDFEDERNYWPVRWLKTLARFPQEYETWLSSWHTIPNGDPPEPLADGTRLAGFMLVPPMTTSTEFHTLLVPAVKNIHFHALIPLTSAEMEFKLKHGSGALMERLERAKITEVVNPARKSVV